MLEICNFSRPSSFILFISSLKACVRNTTIPVVYYRLASHLRTDCTYRQMAADDRREASSHCSEPDYDQLWRSQAPLNCTMSIRALAPCQFRPTRNGAVSESDIWRFYALIQSARCGRSVVPTKRRAIQASYDLKCERCSISVSCSTSPYTLSSVIPLASKVFM